MSHQYWRVALSHTLGSVISVYTHNP